ncbi:hypothetical protein D3C87_1730080 [compost metagenome]
MPVVFCEFVNLIRNCDITDHASQEGNHLAKEKQSEITVFFEGGQIDEHRNAKVL